LLRKEEGEEEKRGKKPNRQAKRYNRRKRSKMNERMIIVRENDSKSMWRQRETVAVVVDCKRGEKEGERESSCLLSIIFLSFLPQFLFNSSAS